MASEFGIERHEPEEWDRNHLFTLLFCLQTEVKNHTHIPDWERVLLNLCHRTNYNYTMRHLLGGLEHMKSERLKHLKLVKIDIEDHLGVVRSLVSKEKERSKMPIEENERLQECTKPKRYSKRKGGKNDSSSSRSCGISVVVNNSEGVDVLRNYRMCCQKLNLSVVVNNWECDDEITNYRMCCSDVQELNLSEEAKLAAFDLFLKPDARTAYLACKSQNSKVQFVKSYVLKA